MRADDLVIAKGCDLSVAGFTSKEPFIKFFERLKMAVAANDVDNVSKLLLYPVLSSVFVLQTPDDLKKTTLLCFPFIVNIIANQKIEDIYCDQTGVAFGRGKVWVRINKKGKVGIVAIYTDEDND